MMQIHDLIVLQQQNVPPVFFDSLTNLLRVLYTVPILYISVIAMVRLSGKRSTSQMNNFDWIVSVAMGSIVASPILLKEVVVLESMLAVAVLLALQWAVTRLSFRYTWFESIVKAKPSMLVKDGTLQEQAMRRERVTEGEVMSAIREEGQSRLADVQAVVLESDARMSVLTKAACNDEEIVDVIGSDKRQTRAERNGSSALAL